MPPMTTPNVSECVKPTPGQPRWNWTGSAAWRWRPEKLSPCTNHFVHMSGPQEPITSATKEMEIAILPTLRWSR